MDQPSFNRALYLSKVNIKRLPNQWNALIGLTTKGCKNARIFHYTTVRFPERNDTVFHEIVKNIKYSGEPNVDELKKVIASGYPWANLSSTRYRYAIGDYSGMVSSCCSKFMKILLRQKQGKMQ